ncbi:hypothetical protein Q8F55_006075 [Vanrija albida]|uniref:Uncharacterized protein n=1 Tax=Vanrija albida TaxID=181172 RepID=A0ABR3Q3R3_9TREE
MSSHVSRPTDQVADALAVLTLTDSGTNPGVGTTGLTFHPDFTEPSNAAIFQSSDNVCFRFDLDRLTAESTFFADFRDVGDHLVPDSAVDTVIPLFSASAEGLAFTFRLLRHHLHMPALDCIAWPAPGVLDEFADIVEAYDLGVALEMLTQIEVW